MKASSIKKKLKEPAFAAKVDRTPIYTGCEHLGIPVDNHIANVIKFLAVLEQSQIPQLRLPLLVAASVSEWIPPQLRNLG